MSDKTIPLNSDEEENTEAGVPTPPSKDLRIVILGTAASGKSAIAYFLQQCLDRVGIEAHINGEEVSPEIIADSLQQRLANIVVQQGEFSVPIDMVQARRDAEGTSESGLILPPRFG